MSRHPVLRLWLIFGLICTFALRGALAATHLLPMTPPSTPSAPLSIQSDCPEHAGQSIRETLASPQADDEKSCRINCDHASAPALPALMASLPSQPPAVLTPTRPHLAIGQAVPPDRPPPIA